MGPAATTDENMRDPLFLKIFTQAGVSWLLDIIIAERSEPLYIELQGVHLSREGTLSIMLVYLEALHSVYIVDVQTLGVMAFSTPASSDGSTTLKTILESPNTPKVCFDVWYGADALYHHYQLSLQGIEDLQLMEYVASQGWLRGQGKLQRLGACITADAGLTVAEDRRWLELMDHGRSGSFDFSPAGGYHILHHRPLDPMYLRCCAASLVHLPKLRSRYLGQLSTFGEWLMARPEALAARLPAEQESEYRDRGRRLVFGPWTRLQVCALYRQFVAQTGLSGHDPGEAVYVR